MKNLLYLFIIIGLFACKSETPKEEKSTETTTTPAAPPAELTYPPFPQDKIQNLLQNCDYIDYVFYTLPISMSLNEKPTIQYAINHIAPEGVPINPACQAIGRIFYMIKGENVAEADIYFNQGCTYFLFYENQKKTYCNQITDVGIQYLGNNIKQGQQMQQQMQQQGGGN